MGTELKEQIAILSVSAKAKQEAHDELCRMVDVLAAVLAKIYPNDQKVELICWEEDNSEKEVCFEHYPSGEYRLVFFKPADDPSSPIVLKDSVKDTRALDFLMNLINESRWLEMLVLSVDNHINRILTTSERLKGFLPVN
jgi:hypothetical protein